MKKWKPYVFWIGLSELVGLLAAVLTMDAMKRYAGTVTQPPFAPPGWVFSVVWPILYALMGIGAARVMLAGDGKPRNRALNIFVAQLTINFFWSLIFFDTGVYGFAFFWILLLWGLILWMILAFRKVDKPAALLQITYLLWVSFAAYLNYEVWKLN